MHSVFVDTDVILDLFLRREPHHKTALHFFSFLKKHAIQGFTSPDSVANTYYILARLKNRGYAIEKVRKLTQLIRIAAVDQQIVDDAARAPYRDFEDSLQYHCALSNGIGFLITRNTSDYPKDRLRVLLPGEYMAVSQLGQ